MTEQTKKYFTEHILPCSSRMYAAALAITGSPDDASDAVQTAMLRIWDQLCSGSVPEKTMSYCLSTVRNICLTETVRNKRKIPIDNLSSEPPQDSGIDLKMELSEVSSALSKLPESERRAVEMNAFAGSNSEEIAKSLGTTSANARQLLSRGRRRLRAMFGNIGSR